MMDTTLCNVAGDKEITDELLFCNDEEKATMSSKPPPSPNRQKLAPLAAAASFEDEKPRFPEMSDCNLRLKNLLKHNLSLRRTELLSEHASQGFFKTEKDCTGDSESLTCFHCGYVAQNVTSLELLPLRHYDEATKPCAFNLFYIITSWELATDYLDHPTRKAHYQCSMYWYQTVAENSTWETICRSTLLYYLKMESKNILMTAPKNLKLVYSALSRLNVDYQSLKSKASTEAFERQKTTRKVEDLEKQVSDLSETNNRLRVERREFSETTKRLRAERNSLQWKLTESEAFVSMVCEASTARTTNSEALKCIICMDADRNTLYRPCHHLLCCEACSKRIHTCPTCRMNIEKRLLVHL